MHGGREYIKSQKAIISGPLHNTSTIPW